MSDLSTSGTTGAIARGLRQLGSPAAVRRLCDDHRGRGQRVGLVPTMGYLHEGHLSLVRHARRLADYVVVSIFVNPTQFGPHEDLDHYPKDLPADLALCQQEGVDLVFTPEPEVMYPKTHPTTVEVEGLSQGLCGARRPGHFRGVCTVVTKLFNIIGPCVAVFGDKDYQQLQVIRRMAVDLDQPVEVVGSPIIREPDGLAMSSRNAYLTHQERRAATCLFRSLEAIQQQTLATGTLSAKQAISLAREIIEAEEGTQIDYIEVRDAEALTLSDTVGQSGAVVALAVRIGRTRLIDNRVI